MVCLLLLCFFSTDTLQATANAEIKGQFLSDPTNSVQFCRAGKSNETEKHLYSPVLGSHWLFITTFHFECEDGLPTVLGLLSADQTGGNT